MALHVKSCYFSSQEDTDADAAPISKLTTDLNTNSHVRINLLRSPNHRIRLLEKFSWRQCKPVEGYCLYPVNRKAGEDYILS